MEFKTIKIWERTYHRMKILAARLGKSMTELIDELIHAKEQELEKQN